MGRNFIGKETNNQRVRIKKRWKPVVPMTLNADLITRMRVEVERAKADEKKVLGNVRMRTDSLSLLTRYVLSKYFAELDGVDPTTYFEF